MSAGLAIDERTRHLLAVMSSEQFRTMQGLGSEVPFFICAFDPAEAVAFEGVRDYLIKELSYRDVSVVDVNLYDLSVQLLKDRRIWDRVLDQESSISKAQLKELLQDVLDPEQHLAPAIEAQISAHTDPSPDIVFISGVGEVFPYIRSHAVLNNLQSRIKNIPTVTFFPGAYVQSPQSGSALDLFGRLGADKYYRAFNIFHYAINQG